MPRYIWTLCLAIGLALAGQVVAQEPVYNYFGDLPPEGKSKLGSSELHHLDKGIGHLRKGTPSELQYAKREFDFILMAFPNHPRVLPLQAETLVRMGKPQLVEEYFQRAYELSPDAPQLLIAHGIALLRMNKTKEALDRLQKGVALEPGSINGQYNLGLALVRAGKLAEANEHAQIAYALGHPAPGLRNQLQKAGAWKPLPAPAAPPASPAPPAAEAPPAKPAAQ